MTDKKPYILLLGGSHDQCFIIKTANQMGVGTVVVDMNPQSPGFDLADFSEVVSTRDVPALIGYAEKLLASGVNLQGVSVMGSDIPQVVQQVAEHFGWLGPTAQTAYWTTHKFAMKEQLQGKGIPLPRFARVNSGAEIFDYWADWGCRQLVVKPVDQAGSRGVWCIDECSQAEDAFTHAQQQGRSGEVIVEEYIEGPQVSTESIFSDGRSATPGLVDRCYSTTWCYRPQIIENGGWYPSELPADQLTDIVALVEKSARALGIVSGVAKGDVVVCPDRGPMLIEMAGRLSGGDFSESLIPLGCGINYVEVALQVALGLPVDWQLLEPKFRKSVINRYFFLPSGSLEQIDGIDEVANWPEVRKLELFINVGEQLPKIISHGQRSGVFIIVTDSREESEALEAKLYRTLKFKIDGCWQGGQPCKEEMGVC